MSEEEYIRKRTLTTLGLLCFLGISIGINALAIANIYDLQSQISWLTKYSQHMEVTIRAIKETVQLANISVVFIPYESYKIIPPNIVTFLSGHVIITGLTNIAQRPIIVNIFFGLTYNITGYGNVQFQQTGFQSVQVSVPALDMVEVPWGAFPITISDFHSGDIITWTLTIRVQCIWTPADVVVADSTTGQIFVFSVSGYKR